MSSTNRVVLSVAMAATILASACGGDDPAAVTVAQPGVELGSSSLPETGDQAIESDVVAPADDTAGGDAPAADDGSGQSTGATTPLASRELEVPAGTSNKGQVAIRVDVLSLTRASGDTIRLEFAIANLDTDKDFDLYDRLGADVSSWDVSGVSLVDLVGNKRYLVLTDSAGACVCTGLAYSNENIGPGGTRTFSAVFPAPPAGTGVLDVQIPVIGVIPGVAVA